MKFVKLFLLTAIPALLLIGGGRYLSDEAMFFGFIVSVSLFTGVYWLSDRVVLKMCSAEMLTVHHSPTLFAAVEEMSRRAGMPMPKIFMIPGETPNAFATGRDPRSASLAFTEGILRNLTPGELRCVIAHELVHIRNRDALVGSLAATMAGISGMGIGRYASAGMVAGEGSRVLRIGRATFGGIQYIVAPFAATVIQSLMNVSREFNADERAAKLSGDPLAMANAIRTMEKKKHVLPMYTSPVAAHLFTVSPLTVGRAARLFNTHPPMEERIMRLEAMARRTAVA